MNESTESVTTPRPPVLADGWVRLYRGASPRVARFPEWLEGALVDSGARDAFGRWFTSDREAAGWYMRDAGPDGRLLFLDMPADEIEAFRVSNQGAAVRWFSADPDNEFFLPRGLAERAQPVSPVAGEHQVHA